MALCLLAACGGTRDTRERIGAVTQTKLQGIRTATIPSGTTLTETLGPERRGISVVAEWSFKPQEDWPTYSGRVAPPLLAGTGYQPVDSQRVAGLSLSKHVPGDTYRVELERVTEPLRIRVRFTASPD